MSSQLSPGLLSAGIVVSPGNSTTIPLGGGALFTGTSENVLEFSEITVNLAGSTDAADGTLYLDFSPDNVNWDVSLPLPVSALSVFTPFPLRIILPFFRVRYQNGAVAQTSFRLTTVYHRAASGLLRRTPARTLSPYEPVTVVRALCEPGPQGNLQSLAADRSIGGEAIASPYIIQARGEFNQTIAENSVTATTAGGATATQSPSTGLVLASSAAAGASSARVVSQNKIRYRPGREFRMEFSQIFPTPGIANSTILIGLSDESASLNRIVLGYVGATFGFFIYSGGAITSIPRSAWNGDPLDGGPFSRFRSDNVAVALDLTKANAWRIRGVWLGVGPVYLEVKSPDDEWVVAHTLRYPNTSTVPYIQSPNMFPFTEVTKSALAGAGALASTCFCWSAGSVESDQDFEKYEILSRRHAQAALAVQTTTQQLWTVSAGKQLLVSAINISVQNAAAAAGQLDIVDAIAGTPLTPLLHTVNLVGTGGGSNSQLVSNITLPIPFIALAGLRVIPRTGSLTYSISFAGYEKGTVV